MRPTEDDLRSAMMRVGGGARAARRRRPRAHPARVVAVMGAKGGVGSTVVACQLAASLRARGARTALVDLNLPLGDVALYFDVQPTYTLANIARESDRLDATYLRTLLSGPAATACRSSRLRSTPRRPSWCAARTSSAR